jgi:hypothetical protein
MSILKIFITISDQSPIHGYLKLKAEKSTYFTNHILDFTVHRFSEKTKKLMCNKVTFKKYKYRGNVQYTLH